MNTITKSEYALKAQTALWHPGPRSCFSILPLRVVSSFWGPLQTYYAPRTTCATQIGSCRAVYMLLAP
jgi:hypothetical protein